VDSQPGAYKELAPHGKAAGIPFVFLGVTPSLLAWVGSSAAFGVRLAVSIIAVQVLGDLVNAFMAISLGGVGFVIAGALLVYLLRPRSNVLCDWQCAKRSLTNSSSWNVVRFEMTPTSGIEFLVWLLIVAAIIAMLRNA